MDSIAYFKKLITIFLLSIAWSIPKVKGQDVQTITDYLFTVHSIISDDNLQTWNDYRINETTSTQKTRKIVNKVKRASRNELSVQIRDELIGFFGNQYLNHVNSLTKKVDSKYQFNSVSIDYGNLNNLNAIERFSFYKQSVVSIKQIKSEQLFLRIKINQAKIDHDMMSTWHKEMRRSLKLIRNYNWNSAWEIHKFLDRASSANGKLLTSLKNLKERLEKENEIMGSISNKLKSNLYNSLTRDLDELITVRDEFLEEKQILESSIKQLKEEIRGLNDQLEKIENLKEDNKRYKKNISYLNHDIGQIKDNIEYWESERSFHYSYKARYRGCPNKNPWIDCNHSSIKNKYERREIESAEEYSRLIVKNRRDIQRYEMEIKQLGGLIEDNQINIGREDEYKTQLSDKRTSLSQDQLALETLIKSINLELTESLIDQLYFIKNSI